MQLVCLHSDVSFGLLGPDDHGFVLPKRRWLYTASPPSRIDFDNTAVRMFDFAIELFFKSHCSNVNAYWELKAYGILRIRNC